MAVFISLFITFIQVKLGYYDYCVAPQIIKQYELGNALPVNSQQLITMHSWDFQTIVV